MNSELAGDDRGLAVVTVIPVVFRVPFSRPAEVLVGTGSATNGGRGLSEVSTSSLTAAILFFGDVSGADASAVSAFMFCTSSSSVSVVVMVSRVVLSSFSVREQTVFTREVRLIVTESKCTVEYVQGQGKMQHSLISTVACTGLFSSQFRVSLLLCCYLFFVLSPDNSRCP